jgi:hypothetical protein
MSLKLNKNRGKQMVAPMNIGEESPDTFLSKDRKKE